MIRKTLHKLGFTNAAEFERIVTTDSAESPAAFRDANYILSAFHRGNGMQCPEFALQPFRLVNLRRRLDEFYAKLERFRGSTSNRLTKIIAKDFTIPLNSGGLR